MDLVGWPKGHKARYERFFHESSRMGQKLVAAIYVLLGPLWAITQFPNFPATPWLILFSALAGILVATVHLRQTSFAGRLGVALGTLTSTGCGAAFWATAILMLTFATDSGEYTTEISRVMVGVTILCLLFAPPLGAHLGSKVAAWLARRSGSAKQELPG